MSDKVAPIVALESMSDLLPDVGDLCGCHHFVLRLYHGEAPHGVQGPPAAHQVHRAPLLGKLCEGLPPEEMHQVRQTVKYKSSTKR